MKRVAVLFTLLALFVIVGKPGLAQTDIFIATGGAPVPPLLACPQGTGFPTDGCAGANSNATFREASAFQVGGYFNTTAGTSTNYTLNNCGASGTAPCRPPWNVAGVDYPIGNYTSPSSMLDPATMSLSGCKYSLTTSGTGGGRLDCGDGLGVGTFAGLLQHINFGPIGGHGCTSLVLDSSAVTSVLIDDIYFFNDSGLCSVGGNTQVVLDVGNATFSGGITIQNFYMDGNSSTWSTPYGGCTPTTICNAGIAINQGASNLVIKYGVMRNFIVHMISPSNGGGCITIENSWVENWAKRAPDSHSEWFDGGQGGTVPCITIDHVVQLPSSTQAQFGPSPVFWSSNYPFAITSFAFTNNTVIDAFIGGGTKTATTSGCIGASFSGGACSGAGSIYFATSITGAIGTGENLPNFGTCSGAAAVLNTLIPGPYPSGVVGEWNLDGFSAGQFWDFGFQVPGSPAVCTNAPMSAGTANVGVLSGDANTPLGSSTITGNAIDPSSLIGATNSQNIYSIGQVYSNIAVASGTITTTGGVSTLTVGSAISPKIGSFVVASGIAGCGGANLGCPTIASETNSTTFVLTSPVAAIGPIAMTIEPLAWCTTPTVFSGNWDMSGLSSTAWMNQWSTIKDDSGIAATGCV